MGKNLNDIGISFIIPCYNSSKTIDDTLSSVLRLELEKFEICLVDDGSVDNTYDILKKYEKKYPEIVKVGKNEKNLGGGAARNECFKMTKYNYIFMLDSDNILVKNDFYKLLDNLEDGDHLVTFGKITFFYSPWRCLKFPYKDLIFQKKEMNFEDLRRTLTHPVVSGNYLYRREVFEKINGYETDFGAMDTWSFGYKALVSGFKYKIVPGAGYLHRVNRKSYWFRELDRNWENLRMLLLRYPEKFSALEMEEIKKAKDVRKVLINKSDDFFREEIGWLYRLVLKLYNFMFFRNYK